MKKYILISILAMAVVVVVSAIFIVPRLVDIESYRPYIESQIKSAVNGEVEIGPMALKIFPRVKISAKDVVIYGEKNINPENVLLKIEALEVAPRILPLLKKRIEIKNINLVRPYAKLDFDEDGNLIFLKKFAEKEKTEKPALEGFSVSDIRLTQGTFDLRKPDGFFGFAPALTLKDFNLALRDFYEGGNTRVKLSATVMPYDFVLEVDGRGENLIALSDISYGADVLVDKLNLDKFQSLLKQYDVPVSGGNLRLEAKISGKNFSFIKAEGSLRVREIKPQNTDLEATYKIAFSEGRLSIDEGKVAVKPFEVATLKNIMQKAGLPALEGTLGLDAEVAGAPPDEYALRGKLALVLKKPYALNINLAYDAALDESDNLRLKNFALTSGKLKIEAKGDVAKISSEPRLNLDIEAKNADLKELSALADIFGLQDLPDMEGVATLSANLGGSALCPKLRGTATVQDAVVPTDYGAKPVRCKNLDSSFSFDAGSKTQKASFRGSASLREVVLWTDHFTKPLNFSKIDSSFNTDGATFETIQFALEKNSFSGGAQLKNWSAPDITLTLNSPQLDIFNLMEILAEESADSAPPAQAEAGETFDFIIKGALSTPRAVYNALRLENFKANCVLTPETLLVDPLQFVLYDGKTSNVFRADTAKDEFPFSLKSVLENVDMNKLVSDGTEYKDLIYGKLFMTLDAAGAGFDPTGMGKHLKGAAKFEIKEGHISSFNLLRILQNVGGLIGIKKGIDENTTRFKTFEGDVTIAKERFDTQNTRIISEDLESQIKGSMDFDGNLDLYITTYLSPDLTAQIKDGSVKNFFISDDGRATLPARVKGTVYEPKVALDTDYIKKMIEKEIKKELKKKVEEKIEKKIEDKLKGLFGK